jgi:aspartate aminotransferase-like enzyme
MTASQKAIAAPPGVTLICVSKRGLEAIMNRKTPIGSYYMNLARWRPVMEDTAIYLATPATQLVAALREALLMIMEEGLENRWRRHRVIADALRAGFESLEYGFLARKECRADTVTGLRVPDGKAGAIVDTLVSKFSIRIAKGLGDLSSRAVRIGHMGIISPRDARYFLTAMEQVTKLISPDTKGGIALDSAESHLKDLE